MPSSEHSDMLGWEYKPAEIEAVCIALEEQGEVVSFADGNARLKDYGVDKNVYLWDAERSLFGKDLGAMSQHIGDCVGCGTARAIQDSYWTAIDRGLLIGEPKPISVAAIYAGSRIQIGGGRLGNGDGSCFVSGTEVTMADGSVKPIESVVVGDVVISHKNKSRKVYRVTSRDYSGSLVTLKARCHGKSITATSNHQFAFFDEFPFGRQAISRSSNRESIKWAECCDLKVDNRILIPFGVDATSCVKKNASIGVKFARLFGLYLAEGTLSLRNMGKSKSSRVTFTFGSHEDELVDDASDLVRDVFGIKPCISRVPSRRSSIQLRIHGHSYAQAISEFCNGNVYTKYVDRQFFMQSQDAKLALARGWMDGDGTERITKSRGGKSFSCRGTSASMRLINDMQRLLLSCELKSSVKIRKTNEFQSLPGGRFVKTKIQDRPVTGDLYVYGRNALPMYPDMKEAVDNETCVRGTRAPCEVTEFGLALPIESISSELKDVKVFCLSVEEDESFIANGYAVHNCGAWAAQWLHDYGVIPAEKVGQYDLTGLAENLGRSWGSPGHGVPKEVISNAITGVRAHKCDTPEEARDAIAAGFGASFCCSLLWQHPYTSPANKRDSEGFCVPIDRGGHCFPAGTIVSAKIPKRIEDISVGDMVYGHDGQLHAVIELFRRQYSGNMVKIKCNGDIGVSCTEEHPILVYRKVSQNDSINNTQGFCLGVDGDSFRPDTGQHGTYLPAWIFSKDVRPGDYVVTPSTTHDKAKFPGWASTQGTGRKLPNIENPDRGLLWLMGYYVGNGNVSSGKCVEFSVPRRALVDTILEELLKLGITGTVQFRGTNGVLVEEGSQTSFRVRAHSSSLAKSFLAWFGSGSAKKQIPEWLANTHECHDFVDGWWAADGTHARGAKYISTTSATLSNQLYLFLASSGYFPCISKVGVTSHKGRYPNGKPCWNVGWREPESSHNGFRIGERLAKKVQSVAFSTETCEVFNIEVDECHSYLANLIAVHNCTSFRGVFHRKNGEFSLIMQQSWGNMPTGPSIIFDCDGLEVELPPGCFAVHNEDILKALKAGGEIWTFEISSSFRPEKLLAGDHAADTDDV